VRSGAPLTIAVSKSRAISSSWAQPCAWPSATAVGTSSGTPSSARPADRGRAWPRSYLPSLAAYSMSGSFSPPGAVISIEIRLPRESVGGGSSGGSAAAARGRRGRHVRRGARHGQRSGAVGEPLVGDSHQPAYSGVTQCALPTAIGRHQRPSLDHAPERDQPTGRSTPLTDP
jgi:hypothetical protein